MAECGEELLANISNASLSVPPAGTAVLGTKESMTEYQGWLDDCASQLTNYSNILLGIFGFNPLNWGEQIPMTSPTNTPITSVATPTATPAIPENFRQITLAHITGGSGSSSAAVTVNSSYWELLYSVDPLVTGGQDAAGKGVISSIFPKFSIQIIDKSTGKTVDTIEPPGGLDITLWQRAGDPRPWLKKYYSGNREYEFRISGKYITSYTIEVRILKND
ncbi:MAG: hypothetical protein WC342_07900 [Methanoregula sp.]